MRRAFILENERGAQEALSQLITSYCPELELVGVASSLSEAKVLIASTEPQLVFLDVELEGESGLDLFNLFPNASFDVIFTTAHQEYAIQAIKFSCLDYLLKPIDFRDLQKAVQKMSRYAITSTERQIRNLLHNMDRNGSPRIALPYAGGFEFISFEELIMATAEGNNTRVFALEKQVVSSQTLGELESILPSDQFFRSHKSFLINWKFVEKYDKGDNLIHMKKGLLAELALRRKDEFLSLVKRINSASHG